MNADAPHPVVSTAPWAVLLVFFMPPELANREQRAELTTLANAIQAQLGSLVRVLRIDEASYPDVVQSFAITQTPAFVLIRRGVELGRQQGLSDERTLVALIRRLLTDDVVRSQRPA